MHTLYSNHLSRSLNNVYIIQIIGKYNISLNIKSYFHCGKKIWENCDDNFFIRIILFYYSGIQSKQF